MSGASASIEHKAERRTAGATAGNAELPAEAMRIVREVVRGSRLGGRAAREVQQELVAHFQDGLEAGHAIADLIAEFGDARTAARLVRNAKLRQQPLPIRIARRGAGILVAFLATSTLAYLASAASLYLSRPPTPSPTDVVARDMADAWRTTPPDVQALTDQGRDQVSALRIGSPGAESAHRVRQVAGILAQVERLRQSHTVAGDRLAAALETDLLEWTTDEIRKERIDPATPELKGLIAQLRGPMHLDGVRRAFDRLLDGMYSNDGRGNGRLTAQGIELVRILKKWHVPTLTDRLAEPAWYSLPASRQSVLSRFDRLVGLAETPVLPRAARTLDVPTALQAEVTPLHTSMLECLRYPSLTSVLPELVDVLRAACEARARRAQLFDLLADPHTAPRPTEDPGT